MKRLHKDKKNLPAVSGFRCPAWLFAVTLAFTLTACESGGSAGDSGPVVVTEDRTGNDDTLIISQPGLSWRSCPFFDEIDCATLRVPMDYDNPNGNSITLALARSQARGTDNIRRVLTNPGGPGGSGIQFLLQITAAGQFPAGFRDRVELITFDPRGIGFSTPVSCAPSSIGELDFYALSAEEINNNVETQRQFAEDCAARHGSYLQQLGSNNVVKDMNEIRKALNQEKLDFLGYSYGTRLAGLYLQTFPDKSGRMVMDAGMSPDPGLVSFRRGGVEAAHANVTRMLEACTRVRRSCDPDQLARQLVLRLEVLDIGATGPDSDRLLSYILTSAIYPGFEEIFVDGLLDYFESSDAASLDNALGLLGLPPVEEGFAEFDTTAHTAVFCSDDSQRPTVQSLLNLKNQMNESSDILAEYYVVLAGWCVGWPESIDPIPTIATNQAPPSLVIGGPTDAQTPIEFSEQLALAVGGQYLRSEHEGHAVAFRGSNRCTDRAVAEFLLDGTLPSVSVCRDDTSVIVASPWLESPVMP